MQATSHFFDQFSARLFHDNSGVITIGKPEDFTADNIDEKLVGIERELKKVGIIQEVDSLMWVS